MTIIDAILLGFVQGLTEFLPISSSGHLVLAETLLGVDAPGVVVEVALHVATLVAVLVVYWRRVWAVAGGLARREPEALRFVGLLVLASIPAGLVGVLLKDLIEQAFTSILVVGIALLVTGVALFTTRGMHGRSELPSLPTGVAIGVAQALAIIPGISRSGSTIATAMWLGVEPVKAAEFSFLLSLVAISGAAVLQIPDVGAVGANVGWGPLLVAFVTALISGVGAIKLLVALLRRQAFHRFAPYCWALGIAAIAWAIVR